MSTINSLLVDKLLKRKRFEKRALKTDEFERRRRCSTTFEAGRSVTSNLMLSLKMF